MKVEFSKDDLLLLEMLLSKAEVETRIEIHHCRTFEFKEYLKKREEAIGSLLTGVKTALAVYSSAEGPGKETRCVLACAEQTAEA